MSERAVFDALVIGWFALAAVFLPILFLIPAPYGRHMRRGWGPAISSRIGWILMEAPAAATVAVCFFVSAHNRGATAVVFLLMWEAHYIHRGLVYPLRTRGGAKRTTAGVVAAAFAWNVVNGYLNGRSLFAFSGGYPAAWLGDPRFVVGAAVFVTGFVINRTADLALRRLRAPGDAGYAIPRGGLYRWVSCPNYLGEIIEWIGWAVATWTLAGLAFAVWTAANLVPRARSNHQWYRATFPDYPAGRKALVPGLW